MNAREAKHDCASRLQAAGIAYTKLTARTVNMSDLARCSPVFVTIHAAVYPSNPLDKTGIPKPSEGGYCIDWNIARQEPA